MTASPAADWLPFDLEVARKEPERVRHMLYLDRRAFTITNSKNEDQFVAYWGSINCPGSYYTHDYAAAYFRLAPAQPAEGECYREADWLAQNDLDWHPTSILPAEGRVVELRCGNVFYADQSVFGEFSGRGWIWRKLPSGSSWEISEPKCYEWRYPPGERAEATINAGAERGSESTRKRSVDSSARENVADCSTPAPAPQRQNLGLWLALRGSAPWPIDKRGTLPALPITSWRIWK